MRLTPSLCELSHSARRVLMSGTLIRAVALISIVPWLLLVATSCSTSSSPPAQTPTTSATARLSAAPAPGALKPTVVLVHGAWADTSSWDGEYDALTKQGYDVRAIANPLENLTTDAASVATFLQSLTGPIVLVGHSYGGSVITQAAPRTPNAQAPASPRPPPPPKNRQGSPRAPPGEHLHGRTPPAAAPPPRGGHRRYPVCNQLGALIVAWDARRRTKAQRLAAGAAHSDGKVVGTGDLKGLLHSVIRPGDRVALEGDNQKQADFLSRTLADCDPSRLHDLHMLISSVSRPEHLDLFEQRIAAMLALAYAGPQSVRIAQMIEDGTVHIGAIHTYVELYARMFVDLAPDVALLCASCADRHGNLYTGPNTEDTPTIAEAAAFHDGVVIVQADEIMENTKDLPRVDIPGDWVDFVVAADRPFALEPLFTRDPRHIGDIEILKAMIAIRGIYERHQVISLNHGVGFDTAAIELLLPTYGEKLGLKGIIARHWVLNPHPTLIPAIESGWVESIYSFGGEAGMENYTAARPDVFFTGIDGSLRSNRVLAQLAGQYAIDMFIGSSLQIDRDANSSTVTDGRLSGFGGAAHMGHDPHRRRHASPAWPDLAHRSGAAPRRREIVVP